MLAGLRTLFSTETFMARGHSYLWTPSLVVLELATNALIALAAVAIGVALLRAAARARRAAREARRTRCSPCSRWRWRRRTPWTSG